LKLAIPRNSTHAHSSLNQLFPEFRTRFHRKTCRSVEFGRVGFRAGINSKKRTGEVRP
jgi:hypothetical protein